MMYYRAMMSGWCGPKKRREGKQGGQGVSLILLESAVVTPLTHNRFSAIPKDTIPLGFVFGQYRFWNRHEKLRKGM